ncbi:MAG: diguanylate cyclase [Treponema sp.]|nr:diguanylate cyclase [Treponema sp.]
MISIKKKLVSLTGLGILLTAILLGSLAIWHLTHIAKLNAHNSLRLICVAEKEHLDITMGKIQQAVSSMKDVVLSNIGDAKSFAKNEALREKLTREFEELYYTIAYHTSGAVAYYLRYNPELVTTGAKGFLWTKRNRFSSFSESELTVIEQYDPNDIEHVGWYYIPVQNGKSTWMTPYLNKNMGIYMISYVIPLYIRGQLIGVVGMDVDFSLIIDKIDELNLYENGYAYLTDEDDSVIYHKGYHPGEKNIAIERNMQSTSFKLNNDWNLVVVAPNKELNAERNRLINSSLCAVLIITFVLFLITTLLIRKIIKPLLELTEITKKVAQGNLNVQFPITSNDEIGILADSFKKTVQHLPEFMYRDALTGLRNASAYERLLANFEERIQNENNLQFGILRLNMYTLKQTNDSYGKEIGDELLVTISKSICTTFSHSPVFRTAEDEFVVILEKFDFENREFLLHLFDSNTKTVTVQGKTFNVAIAHGLGLYDQNYDFSYADVNKKAEEELEKRKQTLQNQLSF